MRVLVLIIASDDKPCYAQHRAVWRERWDLHPAFECKFLQMREGLTGEEEHTFFVQGVESLHPGILDKTVAALRHYLDRGYDFILRTNLSSLWFFDRFAQVLEDMPSSGVYAGVNSSVRRYVSGGGLLLSCDVARLLVENMHLNTTNCVDDVDIGCVLEALGVEIRSFPQCWHSDANQAIDASHFHYYVKTVGRGDRLLEGDTMRRIVAACAEKDAKDRAEAEALLKKRYLDAVHTPSDINEHLPTLRSYAAKCSHVTEAGVRFVVSSWAFALGLADAVRPRLVQIDIDRHSNTIDFGRLARKCGVDVVFRQGSDLEVEMEPTDLFFIDTWHVYGQLKRELARWAPSVRKYIIMHDTTVDAELGESLRMRDDVAARMRESGFPLEEICKGLWPAVEEFLRENSEWQLETRYVHNNGLTILKRS
jgi:hypothetical protein